LYENPNILWLGFKDPSFGIPRVIENLFPHRISIIGIPRDRLPYLITQRESRKFGRSLNIYQLYKYVSGVHAVRLRRVLSSLAGEDYPDDEEHIYSQLRSATLCGKLSVPNISLEDDIGGYDKVKQRLQKEIVTLLVKKEQETSAQSIKYIESLVPRGMIFYGPPGTGKTLFAKAMASALGAAVIVVSGPELKSRWVGESEERLRHIFVQARSSAPAIIIFDELDSFAVARGTYTGSGVEHSMVNQLLTELDGFRANEMVFVVGTTNYVESLDPALLRPGRFEFQLQIPFPNAHDRREIFAIYIDKLNINLSERALDYVVKRTADRVEGSESLYTGDHIQALCRAIARARLRNQLECNVFTEIDDIESALTEYLNRPVLSDKEERVVATHECGHAICALYCTHAPPIERISIRGDLAGSLGFVSYGDKAQRYVTTRAALLDSMCVLFGGREAEDLFLDDLSIGSTYDIERATQIAKAVVKEFGLGPERLGVRNFLTNQNDAPFSENTRQELDRCIEEILSEQRQRAKHIITTHKEELRALCDLLLERKVLDRSGLETVLKKKGEVKNG